MAKIAGSSARSVRVIAKKPTAQSSWTIPTGLQNADTREPVGGSARDQEEEKERGELGKADESEVKRLT
jgi:hypothetical protein